MSNDNSQRTIQMKFRVTPNEQKQILANIKRSGLNQGAYIRKMLLDGPPLAADHSKAIFALARSIDKIGFDIHRITRRAIESSQISPEDIQEIHELLHRIAQLFLDSYGSDGAR